MSKSVKALAHVHGRVMRGRVELAQYHDEFNPLLANNPLIEALPPIIEKRKELTRVLRVRVPMVDDLDEVSDVKRQDLNKNVERIFIPTAGHYDLYYRSIGAIRHSLADRNPIDPSYWPRLNNAVNNLLGEPLSENDSAIRSAKGFYMFGLSGSGKTTAVQRVLQSTLPQVIEHERYKGRAFPFTQVVWLYVKVPPDGSRLSFADSFLRSMDTITGASYRRDYVGPDDKPAHHVNHMVEIVKRVAGLHALGLLVIDDIQQLVTKQGRSDSQLVGFLESLIDQIGIPVLLIGTYKSLRLVQGDLRIARRGSGQGDMEWHRLGKGKEYEYFLKAVWKHWYLREEPNLTQELTSLFYELTQGVVDFTLKLFEHCQHWAIQEGTEQITPTLVAEVFRRRFRAAQDILEAIRTNNTEKLAKLDDGIPSVDWVSPNPQAEHAIPDEDEDEDDQEEVQDSEPPRGTTAPGSRPVHLELEPGDRPSSPKDQEAEVADQEDTGGPMSATQHHDLGTHEASDRVVDIQEELGFEPESSSDHG